MKVTDFIKTYKVGDKVPIVVTVASIDPDALLPLTVTPVATINDNDYSGFRLYNYEEIELAPPVATTEQVVLSKSQAEQVEGYRSGTLLNFVLAMDGRIDLETLVNARLNGYSVAPSYVVVVGSQYFLYFKQGVHLSELGTCEHAREFENIEDAKAVAQLINGKVREVE